MKKWVRKRKKKNKSEKKEELLSLSLYIKSYIIISSSQLLSNIQKNII